MRKILIIDDEVTICTLLTRYLSKHDFEVQVAYTGKKALEIVEKAEFDIVLCDYRLGDMNGNDLLAEIKSKHPHLPIIMMTGYSDFKTAVEVMRLGAYDYVSKPLVPGEILMTLENALKTSAPDTEPVMLTTTKDTEMQEKEKKSRQKKYEHAGRVYGTSEIFKKILEQIDLVAPTNYSVIIYGETGSGKEVIAQEIQQRSKRADKPFIAVDCGTLSRELSGSELFGHEKGAFTGAVSQKIGCFEIANGGTIFLDEVANLPYDIQVSLLRVVQERKMRRVGGVKDIDLDIRILIASNEQLSHKVASKQFREDLYHRFNEFEISVPPLRERKEDIMVFAEYFLRSTKEELGKNILGFDPEIEEIFTQYEWSGNLRELKNVVRKAALCTADNSYITKEALPLSITAHAYSDMTSVEQQIADQFDNENIPVNDNSLKQASNVAERTIIMNALKQVNFNKSKAAQLLNIDRKTLYNKLKTFIGKTSVNDLSAHND